MRTTLIVVGVLLASGTASLAYRSRLASSPVRGFGAPSTTMQGGAGTLPVGEYPLTSDQMQKMKIRNDPREIRAHGWAVLSALIRNDPQGRDGNSAYPARWDDETVPWDNKCTLGLGGKNTVCPQLSPATSTDCQLPKPQDGRPFGPIMEASVQQVVGSGTAGDSRAAPGSSSGGQTFLSTVRYNAEAADFIRKHCLYSAMGIEKLKASDQFDRRAVIVKLIWNMPDWQGQLAVWNPEFNKGPQSVIEPDPSRWPQVKVNMDQTLPCPVKAVFQGVTGSAPASPSATVPINCFYHRSYPCSFLARDREPQTVSPITSFCAQGQTSFEALLMGVHVITAEQDDWVWNTFWWTPNPDADPFHRDQPDSIASRMPWRFYAMNNAISRTQPRERDGSPHIAFNPYLEGPIANSTSSNCMYCHSMAVMRNAATGMKPTINASQEIASGSPPPCLYKPQIDKPCPMTGLLKNDASYFQGATRTHFLWSVADNQDLQKQLDTRLLQFVQIKLTP